MRITFVIVLILTALLVSCGGHRSPAGTANLPASDLTTYSLQTKTFVLDNGCKAYLTAYLEGDKLIIDVGQIDKINGAFTPMVVSAYIRLYDASKNIVGSTGLGFIHFTEERRMPADTVSPATTGLLIVSFTAETADDHSHLAD